MNFHKAALPRKTLEQMMEIALYQPDIAPNAASIMRMAACFGLRVHVIEPAGFLWSDSTFRRAGMDYVAKADVLRQASWEGFRSAVRDRRLVLATTAGNVVYTAFAFRPDDILLMGRESAGVPDEVHAAADARLVIPMRPGLRSLNVAMACAMITGEALRQTGQFPQTR
jgi:tRNA (cytidine/uridine-2'-O-)-methyltransferase